MKFGDRITEAIVGKATAENAYERALMRRYEQKGTEQFLRSVTEVKPEPSLPEPIRKRYYPEQDPRGQPEFIDPYALVRPQIPGIDERSSLPHNPAAPRLHQLSYITSDGPPDLTAKDLTPEEQRNVYSTEVWNAGPKKLPPLLECHGIGRYRSSISADPDAQCEKLKKSLSHFAPEHIDQLAATNLADTNPVAWSKFVNEHGSRRESTAGPQSSGGNPDCGSDGECCISITGAVVAKGFTSFVSPTAAKLYQRSNTFRRKDSGLSLDSPAGIPSFHPEPEPRPGFVSRLAVQGTIAYLRERRGAQRSTNPPARRIERPCVFDSDGDLDSAIASVDSNEESWTDVVDGSLVGGSNSISMRGVQPARPARTSERFTSAQPGLVRVRTTSIEQARPRNLNRTASDRSKNMRGFRPQFRRTHSRKMSNVGNVSDSAQPQLQSIQQPLLQQDVGGTDRAGRDIVQGSPLSSSSWVNLSSGVGSSGSGVWMIDLPVAQQDRRSSPDDNLSIISESSVRTVTPEVSHANGQKKSRARSDTVIWLPPIIGQGSEVHKRATD